MQEGKQKQVLSSPASHAFIAAIQENNFPAVKATATPLLDPFTSDDEDNEALKKSEYALYLGLRWAVANVAYWAKFVIDRSQVALFVLGACIQYVPFHLAKYAELTQSSDQSLTWLAHDLLPSQDISPELNPLNNLWVYLFFSGSLYSEKLPSELLFIAEFLASIGWAKDLMLPENSEQALENLKAHVQLACSALISKDKSYTLPATILPSLIIALKMGKDKYKTKYDEDRERFQSIEKEVEAHLFHKDIPQIVADYSSSGLFRLNKRALAKVEKISLPSQLSSFQPPTS